MQISRLDRKLDFYKINEITLPKRKYFENRYILKNKPRVPSLLGIFLKRGIEM